MSNEVTVSGGGYTITQDAIDKVTNPFLDLNKALNEQFYFLEGQYDQVVLEKIYIILNSLSSTTRDNIATAEETLEEAKKAYEEALSVYTPLREAGVDIFSAENNTINTLIGILNTYTVDMSGIFPSKGGTSCQSAIADTYNDLLSIVCDLFEEEIANITLTAPIFSGDGDLSTLKEQLGTNVIGSLGTTLSSNTYANQFNVDASIGSLLAALGGITIEEPSEAKTNIDAAVTAINTYNGNKTKDNLQAVEDALDEIKDYSEIAAIMPSVSGVMSNITKKIYYDEAVAAINAYNGNKTKDNLQAVEGTLNHIKDYSEIATITPSVSGVISAIDAIDTINTYDASKIDANLQAVKTALNTLLEVNGIPSGISSLIPPIVENIDTCLAVKSAIKSAKTTIDTFKATKNKTNLDAVVAKLQDINAVSTETSYYNASLETAINAAITKTTGIRTRLQNLTDAIDSYNTLTSLIGASAALEEVKRALNAFYDRDIQAQFSNSTLPGLSDRINGCASRANAISTTFGDFYDNLNNLIALCQKNEVKALLTVTEQNAYYTGASLKEPLTYANLSSLCGLLNGYLQSIGGSIATTKTAFDAAVKGLSDLSLGFDSNANVNDLLNLCMMASTPKPQADGTYRLVTGIQRTADDSGNYTYALKYGGATLSKDVYEASFSKEDAYAHYSLPYLALAIMYEKVAIQQMVLVEQLKQVEKINEAIRTNNAAIKLLSWMYDGVYAKSTTQGTKSDYKIRNSDIPSDIGMTTIDSLNSYLADTVKCGNLGIPNNNTPYCVYDGSFSCYYCSYNRDGDKPGVKIESGKNAGTMTSTDTQNIDVEEQATLTMLSNKQDSARIYGDGLSTNSQLMTSKMSQYMQISNACANAASQVVKSVGDYHKTTTSNIRS